MHTSTVEHDGSRVTVSVEWPEYLDADSLSASGRTYLTALLAHVSNAREMAASSLLATYNDNWADDTHPRLSQDQFMARLQLEAVQLLDEPEVACLLFKDSDMFGGHAVVVDFEATTPIHASLFG
jgi:hypothetical protein